ncbi:MAG TPA: retroviral-like aspartic protease family protein [Candidatus Tectomicrobia bacterium]|nr:retroviral-like aspartic protease family protein [Candidatus Tectomicrobia bacterium]
MTVTRLALVLVCVGAVLGASALDLNEAGRAAYARGDFAEAERLFARAAAQEPRDPLFHYHRAVALTRLGRLTEAEAVHRKALKLGPSAELREAIEQALREIRATAPSRPRSSIAERTSVALIPSGGGGWVAEVVLNDRRSARFLVDTGAAISVVTPELAEELGIEPARTSRILTLQTAAGLTRGPLVTIPAIRVGDVEARDVPGVIHPLWRGLDGVLGNTFLGRFKITLHPEARTLTLEPRQ